MASLERALLRYFRDSSPPLLAGVEGRFYYARAKQDPAGDYATFFVISQETLPAHSGRSVVWRKDIQFSVFSRLQDHAAALGDELYRILDGLRGVAVEGVTIGSCWLSERQEFYEEDTELHSHILRFRIQFTEVCP